MTANSPTLPPIPERTGPGRRNRSGPVPPWGLKLGSLLTTLVVFAGSFGYAGTHLYVTNAPLQPATVAVGAAPPTASSTINAATTRTTTTLTSSLRTTTSPAVTKTASS